MAVFGALIKNALGGYADKPSVPAYNPVDVTKEQGAAIAGNLANLPAAQQLASQTNAFNLQQLQKMLESAAPGYASLQDRISQNLQQQVAGQLPADVAAQVQNRAAASAVGGGYGGSGAHNNLTARDLGLTSLDVMNQGIASAERWIQMSASLAAPSMMNVTSMFLTPQQRIQYTFENRERQFQRDWLANQVNALPDPAMAALGDAFIQDEQQIMELVGQVAGMAIGGMCWIAREAYRGKDVTGIRWKLFRHWLLNIGPKWFRNLYAKYGQRFAKWLSRNEWFKPAIRAWMETKVKVAYGNVVRA